MKQENVDYKLRMLWPLVEGDTDPKYHDDGNKKKTGLETRLTDKIFIATTKQQEETFKLRVEFDELRRAFDEKIRR